MRLGARRPGPRLLRGNLKQAEIVVAGDTAAKISKRLNNDAASLGFRITRSVAIYYAHIEQKDTPHEKLSPF